MPSRTSARAMTTTEPADNAEDSQTEQGRRSSSGLTLRDRGHRREVAVATTWSVAERKPPTSRGQSRVAPHLGEDLPLGHPHGSSRVDRLPIDRLEPCVCAGEEGGIARSTKVKIAALMPIHAEHEPSRSGRRASATLERTRETTASPRQRPVWPITADRHRDGSGDDDGERRCSRDARPGGASRPYVAQPFAVGEPGDRVFTTGSCATARKRRGTRVESELRHVHGISNSPSRHQQRSKSRATATIRRRP